MVSLLFVAVQSVLLATLGWAVITGWTRGAFVVPWAWAGAALCAGSAALALAALASLGTSLHLAPAPRRGARFVDHGIYRHLRHPMYTAVVALAAGVFLIVPTLKVASASLVLVAFYLIKSRYEERLLLEHYAEYRAYKAKTRGVLLIRGLP